MFYYGLCRTDTDIRHSLIYDRGYVAMTDTHLLVVEDSVVAEFLAFEHLAKVSTEEAHSFRHRIMGIVAALILLIPSVVVLSAAAARGNPAILGFKIGMGAVFGFCFGLLFLWGICRSRRICWMCVRYANAIKLIPLPGVERERLEQFVQVLIPCLPQMRP